MKTFKRTYCPDSIEHNGKVYVMDAAASALASLRNQQPHSSSVKVIVTNPRLKGRTDLRGQAYPSSIFYYVPKDMKEQIVKEREEREIQLEIQRKKDLEHIEFWKKSFMPRTQQWCRNKLRELVNGTDNTFDNPDEPNKRWNQIEALKSILGK